MAHSNVVPATPREATPRLDIERIRADFPALAQEVHGRPLVYLDSAASAQKPAAVIDALANFYRRDYANVHRGVHTLSQRATEAYEGARVTVQRFLNAAEDREIVFTRGTTEAINLVASSFGQGLKEGDEIVVSYMEHHSNIVPWQMVCQRTGAVLKVVPVSDAGELDMEAYASMLGPRTRLVSMVHVSNALGTINPARQIVELAHAAGAQVLLDGAQAVPHMPVDVRALDADYYVFSGHKLFAPSGIGVLYGRAELLGALPPWQGGGDMIRHVSFEGTTYADLPGRFEAGTPNIAGAVGLAAAIDYVTDIGLEAIARYEAELEAYGTEVLGAIDGLRIVGTAREKAAVFSFVLEGIHPQDVGTLLDMHGVAVRTGHHCTEPLMARMGVPATARASLALYNTRDEIDALARAIEDVKGMFS